MLYKACQQLGESDLSMVGPRLSQQGVQARFKIIFVKSLDLELI